MTGWAFVSSSPLAIPTFAFYLVVVPHLPVPVSDAAETVLQRIHTSLALIKATSQFFISAPPCATISCSETPFCGACSCRPARRTIRRTIPAGAHEELAMRRLPVIIVMFALFAIAGSLAAQADALLAQASGRYRIEPAISSFTSPGTCAVPPVTCRSVTRFIPISSIST